MKRSLVQIGLGIVVLCLAIIPASAGAFSLNATNFNGFAAWDNEGDVIGTYGLDPRLSFEATGQHFNSMFSITVDFVYTPTYPTVEDIMNNPSTDWQWTFSATNLNLAMPDGEYSIPDQLFTGKASYSEIMSGANWAQENLSGYIPDDLCYIIDYDMTGASSGSAYLAVAGNAPLECMPDCFPESGVFQAHSDADLTITAEPVPEPATLLLLGAGLAGTGIFRRKKK